MYIQYREKNILFSFLSYKCVWPNSLFPLSTLYHYVKSTVVIRSEGLDSGSWNKHNSPAVSCLPAAKASKAWWTVPVHNSSVCTGVRSAAALARPRTLLTFRQAILQAILQPQGQYTPAFPCFYKKKQLFVSFLPSGKKKKEFRYCSSWANIGRTLRFL